MPSWAEMLGNATIRGEEPRGVPGGLAGWLMRVLGMIIEIPMLAMLHARQELSLGRTIAFESIRDDDPWDVLALFQEFRAVRICHRRQRRQFHHGARGRGGG